MRFSEWLRGVNSVDIVYVFSGTARLSQPKEMLRLRKSAALYRKRTIETSYPFKMGFWQTLSAGAKELGAPKTT